MDISKEHQILISVVIPTYNRIESTIEAINSVNFKDTDKIEILVVDDFGDIEFPKFDKNHHGIDVKVIRLAKNCGAGVARSAGCAAARGVFVAFLDSDDIYFDDWLDTACRYMINSENAKVFIFGAAAGERPIGKLIRTMLNSLPERPRTFLYKAVTCFFNPFPTPSVVISKDILKFQSKLRYCEDYYTNACAILSANRIVNTDSIACELGRHPNSPGGLSSNSFKMFSGEIQVRMHLIFSPLYPWFALIALGFIYQFSRFFAKTLLNIIYIRWRALIDFGDIR